MERYGAIPSGGTRLGINNVKLISYIIGNIIGLVSFIVLLFCFVLSFFMMQTAYVKVKELLCKQLRHIRIRHKWIKQRIYRDGKCILLSANKVFDSLLLSAKSIADHSVKFIISYTIPMLLAFSVVYYKDSVKEETEMEKEFKDKQNLIEKQQRELKQLHDSISVLEMRFKEHLNKK